MSTDNPTVTVGSTIATTDNIRTTIDYSGTSSDYSGISSDSTATEATTDGIGTESTVVVTLGTELSSEVPEESTKVVPVPPTDTGGDNCKLYPQQLVRNNTSKSEQLIRNLHVYNSEYCSYMNAYSQIQI